MMLLLSRGFSEAEGACHPRIDRLDTVMQGEEECCA